MATVTTSRVIAAITDCATRASKIGKKDLTLVDLANLLLWLVAEICLGSSLSSSDLIGAIAPSFSVSPSQPAQAQKLTPEEKKQVKNDLRKKVAQTLGCKTDEVSDAMIPKSALQKAYSEKENNTHTRGRSVEPQQRPRSQIRSPSQESSAENKTAATVTKGSPKNLDELPTLSIQCSESSKTLTKAERAAVLSFSCESSDTWGDKELAQFNHQGQTARKLDDGFIEVKGQNGHAIKFKASKTKISYHSGSTQHDEVPRSVIGEEDKIALHAKISSTVQSLTSLWQQKIYTLLLVCKVIRVISTLQALNLQAITAGVLSIVVIPGGFDVTRLQIIRDLIRDLVSQHVLEEGKSGFSIVGVPDVMTMTKAQWEAFAGDEKHQTLLENFEKTCREVQAEALGLKPQYLAAKEPADPVPSGKGAASVLPAQ